MNKNQMTYKQQVEELENCGIIVGNEQQAKQILKNVSFFRLQPYMNHISVNPDIYGISFLKIYDIYEFDRQLRILLLEYLEKIEISLRAKISYQHTLMYGSFGYLNSENYAKTHDPFEFNKNMMRLLITNSQENLLSDYKSKNLPFSVVIEFFTFGMLSKFFSNMPVKDRKLIDRTYFNIGFQEIQSWLLCLTQLRNKCAHYSRIYNQKFNHIPRSMNGEEFGNTLFDYLFILKNILNDYDEWWGFMLKINNLLTTYKTAINLQHMGFPSDWKSLLLKEK